MLIADIANSALWESVYEVSLTAQRVSSVSTNYFPIPELQVPILFDSRFVAISAYSTKNPNRAFAGFVKQKVVTGLTVAGLHDAQIANRKLFFNLINLYEFSLINSTYSLSVKTPYWIEDISLNFWQFTGTVEDSTELLIKALPH